LEFSDGSSSDWDQEGRHNFRLLRFLQDFTGNFEVVVTIFKDGVDFLLKKVRGMKGIEGYLFINGKEILFKDFYVFIKGFLSVLSEIVSV